MENTKLLSLENFMFERKIFDEFGIREKIFSLKKSSRFYFIFLILQELNDGSLQDQRINKTKKTFCLFFIFSSKLEFQFWFGSSNEAFLLTNFIIRPQKQKLFNPFEISYSFNLLITVWKIKMIATSVSSEEFLFELHFL